MESGIRLSAVAAHLSCLALLGYASLSPAQFAPGTPTQLPPPPPTPTSSSNGGGSASRGSRSNGDAAYRAALAAAEAQREQEMKRQQEIAKTKELAAKSDSEGMQAADRGDWRQAANEFMEALDLDPDNAEIEAHLQRANVGLEDQSAAADIRGFRERIENSIAAARAKAQRQNMENQMAARRLALLNDNLEKELKRQKDGLAVRQGRVAAASQAAADCIFDGRRGCAVEPVALVEVSESKVAVPPDAARFIRDIPKNLRETPKMKQDIELYERLSSIRGKIQNQLAADQAVAKAHPDVEIYKLKVMQDSGTLTGAMNDEKGAKTRISMAISLIEENNPTSTGITPNPAHDKASH